VSLGTRKSFLVLFSKKNKRKQRLLFEKRSKNFSLLGARWVQGARGAPSRSQLRAAILVG
jgi:hypothetical protein